MGICPDCADQVTTEHSQPHGDPVHVSTGARWCVMHGPDVGSRPNP